MGDVSFRVSQWTKLLFSLRKSDLRLSFHSTQGYSKHRYCATPVERLHKNAFKENAFTSQPAFLCLGLASCMSPSVMARPPSRMLAVSTCCSS